jgi:hypothetical protein
MAALSIAFPLKLTLFLILPTQGHYNEFNATHCWWETDDNTTTPSASFRGKRWFTLLLSARYTTSLVLNHYSQWCTLIKLSPFIVLVFSNEKIYSPNKDGEEQNVSSNGKSQPWFLFMLNFIWAHIMCIEGLLAGSKMKTCIVT